MSNEMKVQLHIEYGLIHSSVEYGNPILPFPFLTSRLKMRHPCRATPNQDFPERKFYFAQFPPKS